MGHVGTDLFSGFVEQAIAEEGIDTRLLQRHDHPVRRVAASFSFEEDRGFVSYVDPLDETIPLEVIASTHPRCVILHGMHYWQQIDAIQRLPNRTEFKLVLDCQDTRLTLQTPGMAERLRAVDVFMPNESEALAVTGESTVERALARLAAIVPLVVIKRGGLGAIAQRGDAIVQVRGLKVPVVDTTGAGDCFNAGFVFGLLRDDPLDLCLRDANITGGLSVTAPGAQAVPRRESSAR
jgi:sugar/nucleoside kinase (ribokinase family)